LLRFFIFGLGPSAGMFRKLDLFPASGEKAEDASLVRSIS
jgi:hypothetical protein